MLKENKTGLNKDIFLAFSGGIDSVASLDYLAHRYNVTLVHIDHGDEIEEKEAEVTRFYADYYNIKYHIFGGFDKRKAKTSSKEGAWRNFRYKVFNSLEGQVITCHQLDDCIESYIFNAMQGVPAAIKPVVGNVHRPFLLSSKEDMVERVKKHRLIWSEDHTNSDPNFCTRNYIRHTMMPHVLKVSPGIRKVVRKIILSYYKDYNEPAFAKLQSNHME